ncbi:MAG: hypothetical protein M3439_12415, partial [Chloroflexota bacterium]|nr:hypothetical protein [Chloroflexota bacterium]
WPRSSAVEQDVDVVRDDVRKTGSVRAAKQDAEDDGANQQGERVVEVEAGAQFAAIDAALEDGASSGQTRGDDAVGEDRLQIGVGDDGTEDADDQRAEDSAECRPGEAVDQKLKVATGLPVSGRSTSGGGLSVRSAAATRASLPSSRR